MVPMNEEKLLVSQTVAPEAFSVLDYVNEMLDKKKKEKEMKKNLLSGWDCLKKKEKTDELKLEWKLIQHENLMAKNDYKKIKKDEKMPKYFQVATLINRNDKIAVGGGKESQSLHTPNRRKKKAVSTLKSFEKNAAMKEWCIKKYTKLQIEKNIGGKSFVRKQRKKLLKMKKGKSFNK